jgi:hypothetical protein
MHSCAALCHYTMWPHTAKWLHHFLRKQGVPQSKFWYKLHFVFPDKMIANTEFQFQEANDYLLNMLIKSTSESEVMSKLIWFVTRSFTDHSCRAFYSTKCIPPTQTLWSWVRILLKAWTSVFILPCVDRGLATGLCIQWVLPSIRFTISKFYMGKGGTP